MNLLVKNLKKCVNLSIHKINKEIKIRSRKISFDDIILVLGNNQSYVW